MKTLNTITDLRNTLDQYRADGMTIGFVPTMGNLHAGHLSLVEEAKKECDIVIASIFVNPLQFGANEDLDTYPRTLEEDQRLLKEQECDLVFAPSVKEMYPNGKAIDTVVDLPHLSSLHCGISRPQFFRGVATVVVKLLWMVMPDKAFFGEKDRQQLTIIKHVVKDLSIPVEIIGVPTKRAASGLALSSRNNYLAADEQAQAASFYQVLKTTGDKILRGDTNFSELETSANAQLSALGFKPDYFHICQQETLLPAVPGDRSIAILAATTLNGTRLIDNITLELS